MSWPKNLATFDGGFPGRSTLRGMEMEAGGMGGIRRVERRDPDGTVYVLNTRNGFPEVVVTRRLARAAEVDAPRGFVARSLTSSIAALYNPYPDDVLKANYTPKTFQYSVATYLTDFNSTALSGLVWNDVLSNVEGRVRLNGKAFPGLAWATLDASAIPVIPSLLEPADYARIFAVRPQTVVALSSSGATLTETLTPTEPVTEKKALLCGPQIRQGEVFLGQLYYNGASYNEPGTSWMYTAKTIAILLTQPYLSAVKTSGILEVPTPPLANMGYSPVSETVKMSVGGTVVAQSGALVTTVNYRGPLYPGEISSVHFGAQPATEWVTGVVVGTDTLSGGETAYEGSGDLGVACMGVAFTAKMSNAVVFRVTDRYRQTDDQYILSLPEFNGQTYSDHVCEFNVWTPASGWPVAATLDSRFYYGENTGPVLGNTYSQKTQTIEFSVASSAVTPLQGKIYVSNGYGYSLHTVPAPAPAEHPPSPTLAYGNLSNYNSDASVMLAKATQYEGLAYFSSYGGGWVTTRTGPASTIAKTIDITTRDYLLFDDVNNMTAYVEGKLTGRQGNESHGTMAIDVTLVINTPRGILATPLHNITTGYDLLPEDPLDVGKEALVTPTTRVLFAPLFRDQSDFKGAVYTTAAEEAAGIPPVCEMSFTLTLAPFEFSGEERPETSNIVFVPMNLLEMLYAFVYSSKYGAGDDYNKYPVTRPVTYNVVSEALFGIKTPIVFKDGNLTAWTTPLGAPYAGDNSLELYRT